LKVPNHRILRLLLIALVVLATSLSFAIGWLFLHVDHLVTTYIAKGSLSQESVILSAKARYIAGESVNKEALIERLKIRSYAPVSPDAAVNIGEFKVTGNVLQIGLKQNAKPKGSVVTFDTANGNITFQGKIKNDNTSDRDNFFSLEPLILGSLGDSAIRASNYRSLQSVPRHVVDALLSIEDDDFYHHFGIDLFGLMRATYRNFRASRYVQGGSTITQQLAKNVLLTPEKTLRRKLIEIFAAISFEFHLSKDEILERYLNEVYFSQEGNVAVHGIGAAARTFFDKDVKELSVAEGALLAGMVQAPSAFSPKRHEERALERRNTVLKAMLAEEKIDEETYNKAIVEKLKLKPIPLMVSNTKYFNQYVREHLLEKHQIDVRAGGIQVHTGIDELLQGCAEKAVAKGVGELRRKFSRTLEQALVVIEPHSGLIKAWVGGSDYLKNQFDHVSQARRQVGSTVKPFLYLTALDVSLNSYKVATTVSILSDSPTAVHLVNQVWRPKNFDKRYHGDVTLRFALERSLNAPAIYVAERVGIKAIAETLRKLNFSERIPEVPSLALGAVDTSLLKLVASYGAIANLGIFAETRPVLLVTSGGSKELYLSELKETKITEEGPAFIMTDILRGVVERGTASKIRRLGFKGEAAGKTGTSDEGRDAWFIGFTPTLTAGVWSGQDDNSKTALTGGVASVPTWTYFMECAEKFTNSGKFVKPDSVSMIDIDTRCNGLSTDLTPDEYRMTELFVRGTEPKETCKYVPPPPSPQIPQEEERNDRDPYATEYELEREDNEYIEEKENSFWDRVFN
jgi:penicillin-binding protein 1B